MKGQKSCKISLQRSNFNLFRGKTNYNSKWSSWREFFQKVSFEVIQGHARSKSGVKVRDLCQQMTSSQRTQRIERSERLREPWSTNHLEQNESVRGFLSTNHFEQSERLRESWSLHNLERSERVRGSLSTNRLERSERPRESWSTHNFERRERSKRSVSPNHLERSERVRRFARGRLLTKIS